LASVEERYLAKNYGETFDSYTNLVPFLVPFLNTRRGFLDVLLSISIPSVLLFILIYII